jgi:hypothetical protein
MPSNAYHHRCGRRSLHMRHLHRRHEATAIEADRWELLVILESSYAESIEASSLQVKSRRISSASPGHRGPQCRTPRNVRI